MKRVVIIVLMLCVTLPGLAMFRHLPAPENSSVSHPHSSADKAGNLSAHQFSTPPHDNGGKDHFSAIPDQENEDDLRKQTLLVKVVAAFIITFLPEYSANKEAKAFASSQ